MAALVTLISPPRGRSGDAITITGTGFAAANNSVDLISPDGLTTIAQSITTENATTITLTVSGSLVKDKQYLVRVTNDDDASESSLAWLSLEDTSTLQTYTLAGQQPGPVEDRDVEVPLRAEAKDFERLAMLAEYARDVAVSASTTGGGIDFGDGSDGAVTISTLVETSGRKNYTNLTITTSGQLVATAGRQLTVLCTGFLDIQGVGKIHADGRGLPGTAGTAGTNASIVGASAAATGATDVVNADVISFEFTPEGGAGGGGGSGSAGTDYSTGDGGDGGSNTTRRGPALVAGGVGGTGSAALNIGQNAGVATAGNPLTANAKTYSADLLANGYFPMSPGAGGAGGGGGSGGTNNFGSAGNGGAGGAAGVQTTTFVGHGSNGTASGAASEASGGGGGGGGGAGGGVLDVRVAGDLTIAAGAFISAKGGNGGNGAGSGASGYGGGHGGGAGGGGGGTISIIYAGSGTNVDAAHCPVTGGTSGTSGSGSGGGGSGSVGLAGEDGHRSIISIT